jgi:hypothetical protein
MTKRLYVCFTPAQREAAQEAMSSRLAGPLEGSDQPLRTYEAAEDALCNPTVAESAIFLSRAEARALADFVGYAHQNMMGEPYENSYRMATAERAWAKLKEAAELL